MKTKELTHKSLGTLSIIGAQISNSGRKVFVANRSATGGRRAHEQLILCAEHLYWVDDPDRINAFWEELAPRLRLTARAVRTPEDSDEYDEELEATA